MTDEELRIEGQRIREWAQRPLHAAAHVWLQDPDETSSKRFVEMEPNGRYLSDRRSKIIDAEVLPAFRLSHPVGSILEPGEKFWLLPAAVTKPAEMNRGELRDTLEQARVIITALAKALAKYRPATEPLRDWEDRHVIQRAMLFLEETQP